MNAPKTTGLLAAPFTPFHADGSLNLAQVPALIDKLTADGVVGAFVCGSNGEGLSMTIDERMAVAEAFVHAAGPQATRRLKIWVHVAHTSIRESRRLMRHARDIGADVASAVAAFQFKLASVPNLVSCMAEIASAAPDLPFYYYHMPSLTGLGLDMTQFLELGEKQIPNLRGIKYTASTIWEYQACLNYGPGRFDVLYGFDEMLLPALSVGAQAAIGSTYNFAAPLYLQVMEAHRTGQPERAQRLMNQLINMVRVITQYPPIPAQKAIMRMLGYDVGPCRLPLPQLSAEQEAALYAQLEKVDFWQSLQAVSQSSAMLPEALSQATNG